MRQRHHRPMTAAAASALGALCALTMIPASTGSASIRPIKAAPLRLPPDTAVGNNASSNLISIDCVRPGSCTAGGGYNDRHGAFPAMVASQVNGRWQRATRLELPPNFQGAAVSDVSSITCAAAGYCTAVGGYSGSGGRDFGFVARESGGRWARSRETEPPRGASRADAHF
jgi:hypothetical protein